MNLAAIGINFRTAPIEVRETVAFRPETIPRALQRIRAQIPEAELALVSTCNRTELYAAAAPEVLKGADLVGLLLADVGAAQSDVLRPHFYTKKGPQAVEHLLAVAASLDSMVVGETEILGQVKQAYLLAQEAQTIGKLLHTAFQGAFRSAKRVHSETDICRGRVSVSSLAVEFSGKVFEDLGEKTVMIVGAGETAELALRSLIEKGVADVLVLNRSHGNGRALAEQYGGRAIQWDLLKDYLPRTDILISSTSAPHCVVHTEAMRRAVETRRGRPILLIDIAVPRDVEAAVGELQNVYLYHIDDLQKMAATNLARRQAEMDKAWEIVREGVAELKAVPDTPGLGRMMQQFDAHGRRIAADALERALAKEALSALPGAAHEEIRVLATKIVNKVLAAPRESMKRAAKNGRWEEYTEIVSDLFGFSSEDDDASQAAPHAQIQDRKDQE
ncbi:MAG: glutamyl-tRNA reductase [Kiritimatiellia bacterium]|jgi:glutamyl-tRNA reductase|nr:glutamyl-tRNA reductase [Kiritimatiellia bacterium]MDP6630087.1 glutamyl-tRNA reductase [Kiritimatiellia bacterium]MDP6811246.1 glutamyl-tRNA reductase [Kiritimatiellia bacterium]MDP7024581.1 glutamyl-tRNA reductase [Kiritimatiellia bacterium]